MFKGRRKKGKQHEHHMDETWLIPYSDLLTLLLALFIVLFAMGKLDEQKAAQLSNSLYVAFHGGSGLFKYESPVKNTVTDPNTKNGVSSRINHATGSNYPISEAGKRFEEESRQLSQLAEKLNNYLIENNLSGQLKTELTEQGLNITIDEKALFESGKADILPASRELAKKISQLLEEVGSREVTISGHTDNLPIKNKQFNSNWDLSTSRAVNFLDVILENKKLDPSHFKATGYGEYRPVADNSTAEGRAKNRRVEITIERLYSKTE